MQFFAVPRMFTGEVVPDCPNNLWGEIMQPVMPVAATLKKTLRLMMDDICASVIEKELDTIQQHPLEIFRWG